MTKEGQIQVTFNWFYILIAGGVILLFFVGMVFKQKAVAEERLSYDVVRVMESIFTAAGVSEKTKNFIDTSGLADHTLFFSCEDALGMYGIKESPARVEVPIEPIFAPHELKTSQVIAWSLPYNLPYKVIDMLFITSANTQYYIMGTDTLFVDEFVNATNGLNVQKINSLDEIDPGKNFQVRVIIAGGDVSGPVPASLADMDDEKVTAVSFIGSNQVDYFRKHGTTWKKLNKINSIPIISIAKEKDSAKYAAIFAADDVDYVCNMRKVFKRLGFVTETYQAKAQEMNTYYATHPELSFTTECSGFVATNTPNVIASLSSHKANKEKCVDLTDQSLSLCADLIQTSTTLQSLNKKLESGSCITIY